MAVPASHHHSPRASQPCDCHSHPRDHSAEGRPISGREDTWFKIVDLVAVIGLGVFAASIEPKLFALSLGGSTIAFLALNKLKQIDLLKAKTSTAGWGGCASIAEGISGIKINPWLATAASIWVLWDHIKDHSDTYVPFYGVFSGLRVAAYTTKWIVNGSIYDQPRPKPA